ncbi:hypothetical protein LTR09_009496 [Extremus antarcticus]|uniref:INO80 complex, subunit Ies4 n=1 Tax=Extremus antarcticus TaxID=702011 RepID=A0AAJ0D909_9PEZI|nr:hypothetical protein LTR09_009496 [Extremus antarcticus]
MSSTTPTAKSTSKASKKSRLVVIRLSPDKLAAFPADVKPATPKVIKPDPSPSIQPPESTEKSSESNSTPIPSTTNDETDPNSLAPPKTDNRRRRGGGTITGRKRAPPSIDPNNPPRERARPGPKKKPRLADGTIDRATGLPTTAAPIPAHKLGPKANTGAINAGLRALDRTGKPCRRWERKGIQLKSFTGMMWGMPSWKAPTRDSNFSGDVKSDTTGSSDLKPNGSSALQSEQSNSGRDGDVTMTNGIVSSPAPPVAA